MKRRINLGSKVSILLPPPNITGELHLGHLLNLFLQDLKSKGVNIMMVLHHFTNPLWFAKRGGWEKEENIHCWVDFAKKVVDEFGGYVSTWNTFNEPNVYASYGWVTGFFPPFKISPLVAIKVVLNQL